MLQNVRLSMSGGVALKGKVRCSGAKNAALPILAACICMEGAYEIQNVPRLVDVQLMLRMLKALRIRAEFHEPNTVKIWNFKSIKNLAPYELVTAMRASFFVAGPILAKTGLAKVPLPGGCAIGARPLDLHFKGFEAMGAKVSIEHGVVSLSASQLKGARIYLDFPSVGATENLMMAACLADGRTILENVAKEPEVIDLGHCLLQAGAKIEGVGTSTLIIDGVERLQGKPYKIIPDRIETGTLIIAGLITKGSISIQDVYPEHSEKLIHYLRAMGATIELEGETTLNVKYEKKLSGCSFDTAPHPGFPTDMQAQMMALLSVVEGDSVIKESIFENRYMHAQELKRMGASIRIDKSHAFITGVPQLSGAEVKMTDLRAGAALILAALAADGDSQLYGMQHLNRGYDDLPEKLRTLGALINR